MRKMQYSTWKKKSSYTIVDIDFAQTKAARETSSSLMDQLRAKNKESKSKR